MYNILAIKNLSEEDKIKLNELINSGGSQEITLNFLEERINESLDNLLKIRESYINLSESVDKFTHIYDKYMILEKGYNLRTSIINEHRDYIKSNDVYNDEKCKKMLDKMFEDEKNKMIELKESLNDLKESYDVKINSTNILIEDCKNSFNLEIKKLLEYRDILFYLLKLFRYVIHSTRINKLLSSINKIKYEHVDG